MSWLTEQEIDEKNVKGIALRSAVQKAKQESNECSDTETLNLLTRSLVSS